MKAAISVNSAKAVIVFYDSLLKDESLIGKPCLEIMAIDNGRSLIIKLFCEDDQEELSRSIITTNGGCKTKDREAYRVDYSTFKNDVLSLCDICEVITIRCGANGIGIDVCRNKKVASKERK